MYLVAVALCVAISCLVDISGAQSGHCTVSGDPHITTYEPHNLINGDNPISQYEVPGGLKFDAKYAISQKGKDHYYLFGVSADFKKCLVTRSCVSTVYYKEPLMNVELILPVKVGTLAPTGVLYCLYARSDDPDCETKIKVNGVARVFGKDGSVRGFPGIRRVGECNSQKCHIIVDGSQGITVSLEINPIDISMYHLNVKSASSLHNDLFGLCDTFTGTTTDHYTPRYGSPIIIWNKATKQQFIESWEISSGGGLGNGAAGLPVGLGGDFGSGAVTAGGLPLRFGGGFGNGAGLAGGHGGGFGNQAIGFGQQVFRSRRPQRVGK